MEESCYGLTSHDFRPRFSRKPLSDGTVSEIVHIAADVSVAERLMKSASSEEYIGDICTKCGKFISARK